MERGTEGCGGKRKHCATTTEEAVNAPKLQGPGSREASYKMLYALLSMAKSVQESEDAFDKKPLNNSTQAVLDNPATGEKLRTAAARAPCSEEAEKLIDRWVDFRWRATGWVKGEHQAHIVLRQLRRGAGMDSSDGRQITCAPELCARVEELIEFINKGSKRGRHARPTSKKLDVGSCNEEVAQEWSVGGLEKEPEETAVEPRATEDDKEGNEELVLRAMMATRGSSLQKAELMQYPAGHSDTWLIKKQKEKALPPSWVSTVPLPRDERFLRLSGGERIAGARGTVVFREDVLIKPADFRHLGMIHVASRTSQAEPERLRMTMQRTGYRGESYEMPSWVASHAVALRDLDRVGGWALVRRTRFEDWLAKGPLRAGSPRHLFWTSVVPTVVRSRTLDLLALRLSSSTTPNAEEEVHDRVIQVNRLHSMEVASALGWWPAPPAKPFWRTLKGLAAVPEKEALMLLGQGIEAESGCAAAEAMLTLCQWKRGDPIEFVEFNAGMGQFAECLEKINGANTVTVTGAAECWDAALRAHSVAHGDHTNLVTVWAHSEGGLERLKGIASVTHAHYSMICSPFSYMCRTGGSIFSEPRQERIDEVLCQMASVMRWLSEVAMSRGLRGISIENVDRLLEHDLAEVWDRILQIMEQYFPQEDGWCWKQMVVHPHIDFGGLAIRARLWVVGGRRSVMEASGHGGGSSEGEAYEMNRTMSIERNQQKLIELGLLDTPRVRGKAPVGRKAVGREARQAVNWSSSKWSKLHENSPEAWAMMGKLSDAQFRDEPTIDGVGGGDVVISSCDGQDVVEFVEKPVIWDNPPLMAMAVRVVKSAPESLLRRIEGIVDKIPWEHWEPVSNQRDAKRRQFILDEEAYGKAGPYRMESFGAKELAPTALEFGNRVAKFCGMVGQANFPSFVAVQEGASAQGMHQDVAGDRRTATEQKWSMAITVQQRRLDFLVEGRAKESTVILERGDVLIFDSRLCHGGAAFPFQESLSERIRRPSKYRYILFMYIGQVTKNDRVNIHICQGPEKDMYETTEERRCRRGRGRISRMILEQQAVSEPEKQVILV